MNDNYPNFFALFQKLLRDHIILLISKMLDGRKDAISLKNLIKKNPKEKELNKMLIDLNKKWKPFKTTPVTNIYLLKRYENA